MAICRVGYGKDLDHFQTKRYDSENFDIEVTMSNGDIIQVNARSHGFAVRQKRYDNASEKTLVDKDF